jgi:NAD(P)H-dependent FMN reductase
MTEKKNILAIIGSASSNSANLKLVEQIAKNTNEDWEVLIYNQLKSLPHFDPELSIEQTPETILEFRNTVQRSDGIIICTPEYVYSIPSGLKNAIEWCISPTVFTDKPIGLITASAHGQKGHEELQLIMKTAMARFTEATTLLIPGIKGKFDVDGNLNDPDTVEKLDKFIMAFSKLLIPAD